MTGPLIRLALLLYTLRLVPFETADHVIAQRMRVVDAVMYVTPIRFEWLLLLKIAARESRYAGDVIDCERRSSCGARTAWQIVPLSKSDESSLCTHPRLDAFIALERVVLSERACANQRPEHRLAAYACGPSRCGDDVCQKLSSERWP